MGLRRSGNSFIRRVRTVLIATAVGASFGCIVVLSFFAPSIEKVTRTQQGQSGQAASTPTLQLNRKPVDIESAKAAEVSGHSDGAAATVSTRSQRWPRRAGQLSPNSARQPITGRASQWPSPPKRRPSWWKQTQPKGTPSRVVALAADTAGLRSVNTTCASETPIRAMRTVTGSGRMPTGVTAAGADVSVFASGEAATLKFHANVVNCAMEINRCALIR